MYCQYAELKYKSFALLTTLGNSGPSVVCSSGSQFCMRSRSTHYMLPKVERYRDNGSILFTALKRVSLVG